MTTTTTAATDVRTIGPIGHREAFGLAEEEYRRFASSLATVADDEWSRPTDCEGWTVRDLAGHVVGAMRSAASFRELLRQQREIKRRARSDGGNEVDHMTALQIELTASLATSELVAECARLVGPAALGRKRTPLPIRRFAKIPVEIGSLSETWTIGYLVDVVLTRDIWMHRVDLARALDRPVELDEHDRRVVGDVVAEWARRHGSPFELVLSGPGGGRYTSGDGSPSAPIELDPVEFCRIVSGRATGAGLLAHEVPF